jgi:hypothetical protein
LFKINQTLQPVSFSEAVHKAGPVFIDSANKVVCHTNIQNAVWAIGQNIDASTCHAEILQDVDGRDKPGHDQLRGRGVIGDRN